MDNEIQMKKNVFLWIKEEKAEENMYAQSW